MVHVMPQQVQILSIVLIQFESVTILDGDHGSISLSIVDVVFNGLFVTSIPLTTSYSLFLFKRSCGNIFYLTILVKIWLHLLLLNCSFYLNPISYTLNAYYNGNLLL